MPPPYSSLNSQILAQSGKLPAGVPRRFLIFSLFTFILALLSYFGLALVYTPLLKGEIADLKKELGGLENRLSVEDQQELVRLYSQINNVQNILASHRLVSPVFSFLERNAPRQTVYLSASLSALDRRLVVDGVTISYEELVRQMVAYERAPEVERVTLEGAEATGNIVRFRISLVLTPQIFSPIPQ